MTTKGSLEVTETVERGAARPAAPPSPGKATRLSMFSLVLSDPYRHRAAGYTPQKGNTTMGINPLDKHKERLADVLATSKQASLFWGGVLKVIKDMAQEPTAEWDCEILDEVCREGWYETDLHFTYNTDYLDSLIYLAWSELELQRRANNLLRKAETAKASATATV